MNFFYKNILHVGIFLLLSLAWPMNSSAQVWPAVPTSPQDPGSLIYPYSLFSETLILNGRKLYFFAPKEIQGSQKKVPLIVFGHGQAMNMENYQETLEHLAKKGVAVLFLYYDNGFFDQDWLRMAHDWLEQTDFVIKKYTRFVDANKIIFSGHSKGGFVALTAAGLNSESKIVDLKSLVVFEPVSYLPTELSEIDKEIPVTLTDSAKDTVVKASVVEDIYTHLLVDRKQLISVNSIPGANPKCEADHFFPLTKSFFASGPNEATALHYYGVWKWLLGAAWDLESDQQTDPYLYGSQTSTSGSSTVFHSVKRNW